jgi:hypothetical protein
MLPYREKPDSIEFVADIVLPFDARTEISAT